MTCNKGGYRIINDNKQYDTYKYEHRVIIEKEIGRPLESTESVHHLDGDKANNDPINLLILENSQHAKLEYWIRNGMPHVPTNGQSHISKLRLINSKCVVCGNQLVADQSKYCSQECSGHGRRRTDHPSKEELERNVWSKPTTHIAKELGISDVAVAKMCKRMGIEKPPRGYWARQKVS